MKNIIKICLVVLIGLTGLISKPAQAEENCCGGFDVSIGYPHLMTGEVAFWVPETPAQVGFGLGLVAGEGALMQGFFKLDALDWLLAPSFTLEFGHVPDAATGEGFGHKEWTNVHYNYVDGLLGLEFGKRDMWRLYGKVGPMAYLLTEENGTTYKGCIGVVKFGITSKF